MLILFLFYVKIVLSVRHKRSIYDSFTDKSNLGSWKGFVYYMPPNKTALVEGTDLKLPYSLQINYTSIQFDKLEYELDPLQSRFDCDFEEYLPCPVSRFISMYGHKYKSFQEEASSFMTGIQLTNPGGQCFVLSSFNEAKSDIDPFLICVYVENQTPKVKQAFRNAYLTKLQSTPYNQISINIQYNDKFEIEYANDRFFNYFTTIILKPDGVYDAKNKQKLISYDKIESQDGQYCQINEQIENQPKQLISKTNCCVFMKNGEKEFYLCVKAEHDCIYPIKQLSNFLSMYLFLNKVQFSKVTQNDYFWYDYVSNPSSNIWKGWGFLIKLPNIQNENFIPIYISVMNGQIILSKKKTSDTINKINIINLNWELCFPTPQGKPALPKKICHPKDFFTSSQTANKNLIMENIQNFMQKVNINLITSCSLFQEQVLYIIQKGNVGIFMLCIYNYKEAPSFEDNLLKLSDFNYDQREFTQTIRDVMQDNTVIPLLITNGEIFYQEKIQFQYDQVVLYKNKQKLFKYSELDLIQNQPCQILTKNQIYPEIINNYNIKFDCCLSFKFLNTWNYICVLANDCTETKLNIADKIQKKCYKSKYMSSDENAPNINYNSFNLYEENLGVWKGYVKYVQIGHEIPRKPLYLEVSPKKITVKDSHDGNIPIQEFKIDFIDWICDSELPCTAENYIQITKVHSTMQQFQIAFNQINVQSQLDCTVVQFRTTDYLQSEKQLLLICPFNNLQITPLRQSIASAYDIYTDKLSIEDTPFALAGSIQNFEVYVKSVMARFKQKNIGNKFRFQEKMEKYLYQVNHAIKTQIRLIPVGIEKLPEQSLFFDYQDIKPTLFSKCQIDQNPTGVPEELCKRQKKNQCCFTFKNVQDQVYVCSGDKFRCIVTIKMVIKRMRSDCMRIMANLGLASATELDESSEKITFSGIKQQFESPKSIDVWYHMDYNNNFFEGTVYFMQFSKDRESLSTQKAFIQLDKRTISLSDSPKGKLFFKKNIFQLHMACDSSELCLPHQYLMTVKNQFSKIDFANLQRQFVYIMDERSKLETSCFILQFEHYFFHTIESYIVCLFDDVQGSVLRQLISKTYEDEMFGLNVNTDKDIKYIPDLQQKDSFNVVIINLDTNFNVEKRIILTKKTLKAFLTDAIYVKYHQVKECKVIFQVEPDSKLDLPSQTNINCCFQLRIFDQITTFCVNEQFACIKKKNMIIKFIILGCIKNLKNQKDKAQALLIKDNFQFGLIRQGVQITPDQNLKVFSEDTYNNEKNSMWAGWAFAAEFTNRRMEGQITVFYMTIDKRFLSFYKDKNKEKLITQYNTHMLKFACATSDQPCLPSSYINVYASINEELIQIKLQQLVQDFLDFIPSHDETSCFITDIEQPVTRAISSEMICTLEIEDAHYFREAIKNSYYTAQLQSIVSTDTPLANYITEQFAVSIWEENQIFDSTIFFNKQGLAIKSHVIYYYDNIASDKYENDCAFWFKNIKLPDNLRQRFEPNCCFTFYIKKGNQIFVCSNDNLRCIKPIRTVLKRLHHGCSEANQRGQSNIYESLNSQPAQAETDVSSKLLFDDSSNGVWKGIVIAQKVGDLKALQSSPIYLAIQQGYITFFDKWVVEGSDPKPVLNVLHKNVRLVCIDDKYTCSISSYTKYYDQKNNEQVKQNLLRQQISVLKSKLDKSLNLDTSCAVINIVNDTEFTDDFFICSQSAIQGENIKKAISTGLDNLLLDEMIESLPNYDDEFKIVYIDPKTKGKMNKKVKVGDGYIMDTSTGQKIFDLSQVQDDNFGNKCTIWYKSVKLPDLLLSQKPQCCMMFKINAQDINICSDEPYHCIYASKILLKKIKTDCLTFYRQNSAIPCQQELKKQVANKKDEDEERPNFFKHDQTDDFVIQEHLGIFKSWILYGIIPNVQNDVQDPIEAYMDISLNGITITTETKNVIEVINPLRFYFTCNFQQDLCSPGQFLSAIQAKPDPSFQLKSIFLSKMMNIIRNDKSCIVVEYLQDNVKLAPLKRLLCLQTSHQDIIQKLNQAIAYVIEIRHKNLQYDEIISPSSVEQFQSQTIKPGETGSEEALITLGKYGLEVKGEGYIKYGDFENCNMCYSVQQNAIENKSIDKDCCIEFSQEGKKGYICDQDQFRCFIRSKQLAKYIYEQCKQELREAIAPNPQLCLFVDIKHGDPSSVKMDKPKQMRFQAKNDLQKKIVEDNKQLIRDKLIFLNKQINQVNNRQIIQNQNIEGVKYDFNSDGSVTMTSNNGTQVTSSDAQTLTIGLDNKINLKTKNGDTFKEESNGDTEINLQNESKVIQIKNGNYEVENQDYIVNIYNNGTSDIEIKKYQ